MFILLGLKKVTSDMQTHKNPALRPGPAPFKPPVANKPVVSKVVAAVDKPPVFNRDGKKWIIVNKKSVFFIFLSYNVHLIFFFCRNIKNQTHL